MNNFSKVFKELSFKETVMLVLGILLVAAGLLLACNQRQIIKNQAEHNLFNRRLAYESEIFKRQFDCESRSYLEGNSSQYIYYYDLSKKTCASDFAETASVGHRYPLAIPYEEYVSGFINLHRDLRESQGGSDLYSKASTFKKDMEENERERQELEESLEQ